ncbi:ABC transporter substrate-binding protein [Promicromonospora sp. Populi]|uniref:peptide ABC transporter substrate-binding protein n=1 Tax=Promicromonospora sp. Populi TaxID=3239420 RepID=UPI0034E23573
MRQARIATFVAGAAVVALTVTGCTPDDTAEEDGPVTLNLTTSQDMETLFPGDSGINDSIGVLDVVYDGLVRYDPETTEPYNYVAESIESDDNTVWTITIKPDLTFQNGEPVDAAAFARSWNYTAGHPELYSNYFFERFAGYEDMQDELDDEGETVEESPVEELSGLTVVDDLTLEVTLNAPFAGFATMLGYTGFYPIAEECLADVAACSVMPIGNGPFQITEWEQGVSLDAERWTDYPLDETPGSIDAINWREYSGASSWSDFETGDVDVSYPAPADLAAAQEDPELSERLAQAPGAALTYIGFPLYEDGPWQDIEFRKAISMAIDRDTIIENLSGGLAAPADSWVVPDGVPGGVAGTCEWCTFDPEAAQAALEAAGGWPEGETLTISLGDDEEEIEYFQAIGNSIEATLGIPYELAPNPDYFSVRSAQGFDGIFRNNWFPDYPLNENYLAFYAVGEEGAGNFGWYSEEFEAKLAEGDRAATLDEAVVLYQEAEAILAEEFPTIPFRFNVGAEYYSERLDNVVLDPFSGAVKVRLLTITE